MVRLRIVDDGIKFWYLNELWHRANGPTICWDDGDRQWYWHDQEVTEYEHMMLLAQEQING